MSRPSYVTMPAVIGARPSTARPRVVLPDPDYPTNPSVAGGQVEGDTMQRPERLSAKPLTAVLDDQVLGLQHRSHRPPPFVSSRAERAGVSSRSAFNSD